MTYFTCEKIEPTVTRINCPGGVYAFLVEGSDRALLIDTGLGYGDLSAYVKTLTDLPVTVFLTHGHLDHAGGLIGFDDIHLHHGDWTLIENDSLDARYNYTLGNAGGMEIKKEDFQPGYKGELVDVKPGEKFDLGGVTVTALPLKGHTDGMMAAYIEPQKSLILGDGLNSATFFFTGSATVSEYKEQLLELAKLEDEVQTVYYSHPHNYGGKEIIREAIAQCEDILAGKDDHVETPIGLARGMTIYASKAQTPQLKNVDGSCANIFYRPEQVK